MNHSFNARKALWGAIFKTQTNIWLFAYGCLFMPPTMPRMPVETNTTQPPARRLVIFDGIMGSGKSTSTRWLGQRLADLGISASIQVERQFPHPLRATDAADDWFKPWLDMTADQLAARRLALWEAFTAQAPGVAHRACD
jgi:hypothetical protein